MSIFLTKYILIEIPRESTRDLSRPRSIPTFDCPFSLLLEAELRVQKDSAPQGFSAWLLCFYLFKSQNFMTQKSFNFLLGKKKFLVTQDIISLRLYSVIYCFLNKIWSIVKNSSPKQFLYTSSIVHFLSQSPILEPNSRAQPQPKTPAHDPSPRPQPRFYSMPFPHTPKDLQRT